jgi:hypothetical protein
MVLKRSNDATSFLRASKKNCGIGGLYSWRPSLSKLRCFVTTLKLVFSVPPSRIFAPFETAGVYRRQVKGGLMFGTGHLRADSCMRTEKPHALLLPPFSVIAREGAMSLGGLHSLQPECLANPHLERGQEAAFN